MWLINSPIGRKVVMSSTGICLILFLTFHCCMNIAAFFSGEAYNMICSFLGSNWYAVAGTMGLGALAVFHIVYAFILTAQNRRARGNERYAVSSRRPEVSWASQNMLVLGLIILIGLLLHLYNFWGHMMFAELAHIEVKHHPADGFAWIQETFANPIYSVLYLLWILALWFHLEWKDLAKALAMHRTRLCNYSHMRICLLDSCILAGICTELRLCRININTLNFEIRLWLIK